MQNKKLLITGFSGFVAAHFMDYLYSLGIHVNVCGVDIREPSFDIKQYLPGLDVDFREIDMTDAEQMDELFHEFTPDYILHLAAYSSVAYSWKNPAESFINNNYIFLNLVKMVQKYNPRCRMLSVGSSEEYGVVEKNDQPIREGHPLHPANPYAVARVSQEMLSQIYVESFDLNIIMTRSFHHIGPRQDGRFVVPSFISRILNIKKMGEDYGEIDTGDISVVCDFVDVRDVVRAYYLLLLNGKSGEVYNICSGEGISLVNLINMISRQIGVKVTTRVNPELLRPDGSKITVGSCDKIKSQLGWYPEIELLDTVRDMIHYIEETS